MDVAMIKKVVVYPDAVTSLHATPEGLWVGHQGGLSFCDPHSGNATSWSTADGLPAHPVTHIASGPFPASTDAARGSRLVVGTVNGVAWVDDRAALLQATLAGERRPWSRALMHEKGDGVHVNGVSLVNDRIYVTTGGGRLYFESDPGFKLIALPLQQARLLRVVPLACAPSQRRLLIVTNNSGVLLLATGDSEESSLYQWGEDEEILSRYVTAIACNETHVMIGVHGGIHFAAIQDLVQRPGELTRWGRVHLGSPPGPAEQKRIHDLVVHADSFFAATSAGLYQIELSILSEVGSDSVTAHRVEESTVRHLASFGNELWAVRNNELGHFLEGSVAGATTAARPAYAGDVLAQRTDVELPRITSYGRRWRFLAEMRWRRPDQSPACLRVASMRSTESGLVIGGEAGCVALYTEGRWSTEVITRTRRPPEVQSIALDPDSGNLWVTTRHGLFQRMTAGRWHRDATFPGRNVHSLEVWNDGVLALSNNGLYEFSQGAWTPVLIDAGSLALSVSCVGETTLALADRAGAGLVLWQRGQRRPAYVAASIGRANCMAWDEQQLWIGGDRGLLRWRPEGLDRFVWDDDEHNHISALVVHRGSLYVGSSMGVWQERTTALAAPGGSLQETGQRSGLLDGLPHLQVTSMAVFEDDVWVGTQAGLAVLD